MVLLSDSLILVRASHPHLPVKEGGSWSVRLRCSMHKYSKFLIVTLTQTKRAQAVHAILERSTLMNVLYGLYSADEGEVSTEKGVWPNRMLMSLA